ncbi:HEPN domain-containing protein [Ferruginibacter paludis]|uniref:HEPN domain-containing protein n=1 Tax=Ferruginibacter paludis TaxID=1310417 RepID=UPI0025B2E5A4|nr:HEPN domain-containing protein [Ferruginibacter paludis]MDN3658938.1 HEPN domain-containing protein [Ferruginibacter paludis]
MEIRILSELSGIQIAEVTDEPIFSNVKIACCHDALDQRIFDKYLQVQIGLMHIPRFVGRPYFWDVANVDADTSISKVNAEVHSGLVNLIGFLWFVKDTSANVMSTFSYAPELHEENLFQLSTTNHFTNATGDYADTVFDRLDFIYAGEVFKIISKLTEDSVQTDLHSAQPTKHGIQPSKFNHTLYNTTNRIQRALSFLVLARSQSFLPLKISFYTAMLECLFTTDSSEVSHKTAERTAFYFDWPDRYEVYEIIKLAYGLRSKFFHGQILENKVATLEKQKDLSVKLDDIIRKVLISILFNNSAVFADDDRLNAFLNSKIFASSKPNDMYSLKSKEKNSSQMKKKKRND